MLYVCVMWLEGHYVYENYTHIKKKYSDLKLKFNKIERIFHSKFWIHEDD